MPPMDVVQENFEDELDSVRHFVATGSQSMRIPLMNSGQSQTMTTGYSQF